MATTTCRLAAAPLGLAPLPRRPTTVAFAVAATGIKYGETSHRIVGSLSVVFYSQQLNHWLSGLVLSVGLRASRSVAIRAADGTGGETEVPEIVKAAQDAVSMHAILIFCCCFCIIVSV